MHPDQSYYKHLLFIILPLCIYFFFLQDSGYSQHRRDAYSVTHYSHERLLLQTDRDVYVAGEELFFKLNLINVPAAHTLPASNIVYLVFRNRQNTAISRLMVKLRDGNTRGSIYLPDTLHTGLYQLVAFTHVMKNRDETAFPSIEIFVANKFDKNIMPDFGRLDTSGGKGRAHSAGDHVMSTNPASPPFVPLHSKTTLELTTPQQTYGYRKKIVAFIHYTAPEDDSLVNLSVSVADVGSFMPEKKTWAMSPLPAMNQPKLSTRQNKENERYLPEVSGIIIRGHVFKENTNLPARGIHVLLSTPDSIVNMDYAITDTNGIFRFLPDDYFIGRKLIFNIKKTQDDSSGYKILIEDRYTLTHPFAPSPFAVTDDFRKYVLLSQDIARIHKTYNTQVVKHEQPPFIRNFPAPLVYATPQFSIYTKDYVPLNDLMEFSRNLIPFLKIRKKSGSYTVRISNAPVSRFFSTDPGIFLDGVEVDNISGMVSFGSREISKIELITSLWRYGDIRYPGILAVFRKTPGIDDTHWGAGSVIFNTGTFALPASFLYTTYGSENMNDNHHPDFRQLLYWNPELTVRRNTVKEISFFSGDLEGVYRINVTGITTKGIPLHAETQIRIKPTH